MVYGTIERVNSARRTLDFSPELRGRTLWLGSDNPHLVDALQQIVGVHGLTVHGFSTRQDVLQADEQNQVDFIVLDEAGEDWNRTALANVLASTTNTPILALLRTSERESFRSGRDTIWAGNLIKPFRTTLILHSLRGIGLNHDEDSKRYEHAEEAEITHLKTYESASRRG